VAKKDAEKEPSQERKGNVKDTYYYDVLGVAPTADESQISHQYYKLASECHPDKDEASAEKFRELGEAYQVLSDPLLREKYDTEGRDAITACKSDAAGEAIQIDPAMLFAFLYGSENFQDYIGTVSTAVSAMIGDSPKVSAKDARTLQKRRCARLALKLADRLKPYVEGATEDAKAAWNSEGEVLVTASYGYQLLNLIGQVTSKCVYAPWICQYV